MADYRRDLEKRLREAGCYLIRQGKGDHEIWYSPKTNKSFPLDSKIKSRHTANGVLKQAGFLEGLLIGRRPPGGIADVERVM